MLGLSLLHCKICMDEGVVAHVRGGEGFYCEVSEPIAELVVTSRYEAVLLKVQGITDGSFGVATILVGREV